MLNYFEFVVTVCKNNIDYWHHIPSMLVLKCSKLNHRAALIIILFPVPI